jgi:hypothetical protein
MAKRYELVCLVLMTLLTAGCESGRNSASHSLAQNSNENDIARCEKELQALKTFNSQKYAELDGKFEQVMNGAASYAGVRGIVDPATQHAVDALYQFRSAKVCAEIHAKMLESLVAQSGVNP